MKKFIIILFFSSSVLMLLSSFISDDGISFPEKKILKLVRKTWKVDEVEIVKLDNQNNIFSGTFYSLNNEGQLLGYLYLGRVNSCREGGCSINADNFDASFEFFDYFFITDTMPSIKKVRIFNYQATQGHEVMSSGWLGQFIGYNGDESLRYGKEIETISGATISAKALNMDVQEIIKYLKGNQNPS